MLPARSIIRESNLSRTFHPSDGAPNNVDILCGRVFVKRNLALGRQNCHRRREDRNCVGLEFRKVRRNPARYAYQVLDYQFNYFKCDEKRGVICEIPERMPK